jgi:hypothetical protein
MDKKTLILLLISLVGSVTLMGVTAQIRNTDTKLDLHLKDWVSLTVEGKRSIPEKTKVDCLPGGGNSQPLNCDIN